MNEMGKDTACGYFLTRRLVMTEIYAKTLVLFVESVFVESVYLRRVSRNSGSSLRKHGRCPSNDGRLSFRGELSGQPVESNVPRFFSPPLPSRDGANKIVSKFSALHGRHHGPWLFMPKRRVVDSVTAPLVKRNYILIENNFCRISRIRRVVQRTVNCVIKPDGAKNVSRAATNSSSFTFAFVQRDRSVATVFLDT